MFRVSSFEFRDPGLLRFVLHFIAQQTQDTWMESWLTRFIRQRILAGLIPEGRFGIRLLGHRLYVGGQWDKIGRLQFEFMKDRGLQPGHCLLDIGCGALRGGVHFIRYLDPENYLGIDKEERLLQVGLERELGKRTYEEKRPSLVSSDSFEFSRFEKKAAYSISVSLFTHLPDSLIRLCLQNLKAYALPGHRFFASFFLGNSSGNASRGHSLDHFEFSQQEMSALGMECGWETNYLG